MRTTIVNDFLVLISVTAIAGLALLFASRTSVGSTGASCGPNAIDLDSLAAEADGQQQVIRLTPPGSQQQRKFRVENALDGQAE